MGIELTRHEMGRIEALGPEVGDAITVNDGEVSEPLVSGLYRLVSTGPCRVRLGLNIEDAQGGGLWPREGMVEVRTVSDGLVLAVDAAS